jgi:hypothetical protein
MRMRTLLWVGLVLWTLGDVARTWMGRLVPALATNKWGATWTSRGTVLTTELNTLGISTYSGLGTEIDNTTNLDIWAMLKIDLASLTPTSGAYLQLFLVQCGDGTNYEDAPSSTNPGGHMSLRPLSVATGAGTKRIYTPAFRIPPGKWKFVLLNGTGVALASSGNTVTLYTTDEAVA